MSGLKDRVIIITGAGRGLGRAYALDLAKRGARIVVNTRARPADAPGSAEGVVAEIKAIGGQAVAAPLAVEAADSGERLLQAALDTFGRVDGLLNNAGAPEAKTLHKQTTEAFREVFEVNFFGSLTPTLPIYRHMREQGYGRIVMSTSAAGLHGVHGMASYSASKAALIGLMRTIALEGGPRGVHCNALAPYAATGMTAEYLEDTRAKLMSPERVAPVASWLMSSDCPLNGESIVAGCGTVRRAARIEGPGIHYEGDFSPEDLTRDLEALTDISAWKTFGDGQIAFEDLMANLPTPL
ncbi:SDR family NAD(P)-dependent oxidoreductase [uncultured Brevundimonas sp.]|uniref:SDR family NAD(P)-dependent oxidoreductase n=1 Tax=uncultured Brevundimonas sp. TaxID=213418 RepID=UPI00261EE507|nr:SDR family NAD(P)-dependent oxidoreductase [uncultured Brevundimonas sp.]